MNQDIKQKWVTALRSGEYKQGFCRLRGEANNFCCLGVLCDLAAKDGAGQWDLNGPPTFVSGYEREIGVGSLTPEIQEWAGLPTPDPVVRVVVPEMGTFWRPLSNVNDALTLNFAQIADAIEAHL